MKIKNNLQGNNRRVGEAKNQINDLEHKEAKNNQSVQQEERRIQKMRIVCAACGTTLSNPTEGCQKEKRKSKKLEIYLKK